MSGTGLADLVVGVATSYALIGLLVALTVVALLAVTSRVMIPPHARPGFFGLYGGVIGCFLIALAAGQVKSPGQAAAEAQAFADSGAASSVRARNVTPADDLSTGSIVRNVVYIQAPDMDRRFEAEGLWKALTAAGVRTPGIELVGGRSPSSPEVRYFNEGDRPFAERVAAIAAQNGLPGATVRADASYKAPRGQVELWYPR